MRKKQQADKNSLRTLLIFCAIVGFSILCSLLYRTVVVVKDSTFDGKNRYTIAFTHNKELDIVSVHPSEKTFSHLEVRGVDDIAKAKRTVGVFVDAEVKLTEAFQKERVASYLWNSLMKKDGIRSTIPLYDSLRLALLTQGIPQENKDTEEIQLPLDQIQTDIFVKKLFNDSMLVEENKTIHIKNGAGVAGFGSRLERVINNMGGTVIAVSNTEKLEKESSLSYYGEKTYTVERLSKLLQLVPIRKEGNSLSDIIITIGKDKADENKF